MSFTSKIFAAVAPAVKSTVFVVCPSAFAVRTYLSISRELKSGIPAIFEEELKGEKLTVTRVFPSGIFKSPESVFVSRPNSLKFILQENIKNVEYIIKEIRKEYPEIKIYVWTGYTLEELRELNFSGLNNILNNIDVLIDGRFVEELKDTSLKLRGSSNQRILLKGKDF